jgi:hypothetical protein
LAPPVFIENFDSSIGWKKANKLKETLSTHEDIQEILGIYDLKQDFKEEKYFNLSNHIIQSILNIRNERTKLNPVSSPKAQFRINLKL